MKVRTESNWQLIKFYFKDNYPVFFGGGGLWGYWHWGYSWLIVPASGDSEDDCGEADGM
jgi:hypothetical protein